MHQEISRHLEEYLKGEESLRGSAPELSAEFHSHLGIHLRDVGRPSLASLVGQLVPAGKERIPLQAADLLCWHTARARHPETMNAADFRRYATLAHRQGHKYRFPKSQISKMMRRFSRLPKTKVG